MTARIISTEQWLAERGASDEPSLGSSDAAAACAEHPQVSRIQLWGEKLGLISREEPEGEWLLWGNALEPAICRVAAWQCGLRLIDTATEHGRSEAQERIESDGGARVLAWVLAQHPAMQDRYQPWVASAPRPWQRATLDSLGIDEDDRLWIVEAKNNNQFRGREWKADAEDEGEETAPPNYALQCWHGLAIVTAAHGAVLAGLIGGNHGELRRYARESAAIDALIALETEFMRMLVEREEPPVDEVSWRSAGRALRALHPTDNGKVIRLPREIQECMELWDELEPRVRAGRDAEKARDQIKVRVRAALRDDQVGLLDDGRAFSAKTNKRGARPVLLQKAKR